MSLLDKGRQMITVYPEVTYTDEDGNLMSGPSETGITTRASIQPAAQSGTSARRREQDEEVFLVESVYTLRLPRRFPYVLNAQARIEWNGEYWAVIGDPYKYDSSNRTAHYEYSIRRT